MKKENIGTNRRTVKWKGKRIRHSLLSFALAVSMIAGNCMVTPSTVYAEDSEEIAVSQPAAEPSAEPVAEPTPEPAAEPVAEASVEAAPYSDTGEIADVGTNMENAASGIPEGGDIADAAENPSAQDAENLTPDAQGAESLNPDAQGTENLNPDEQGTEIPDASEKEDEDTQKDDIESDFDKSTVTSSITLVYRYGDSEETATVTLKGDDSISLSGQARSFEGYELSGISLSSDGQNAAAAEIIQRIGEDHSASLFYRTDAGEEIALSGGASVVFTYQKAETEEKEDQEEVLIEIVVEEELIDPEVVFTAQFVDTDGNPIEGAGDEVLPLTGDEAEFAFGVDSVRKPEGYQYDRAQTPDGRAVTKIRKETTEEVETVIGDSAAEAESTAEGEEAVAAEDTEETTARKEIHREIHRKTVHYFITADGEETEVSESMTIQLRYEKEIPEISLKYRAVDAEGAAIDGRKNLDFPDFDGTIRLDHSPLPEEVTRVELVAGTSRAYEVPYEFVQARINGAVIDELNRTKDDRTGRWIYSCLTGGETTTLTQDTTVVLEFREKEQYRTLYLYRDDLIEVTVRVADANAVPDDAELVVTPIGDSQGREAYFDAINRQAGAEIYDTGNTLIYDIALMVDGKDGGRIEYEPRDGEIEVSLKFRQGQLSGAVSEEAEIEVSHLPLTQEKKAEVDATIQAQAITADDVLVEDVRELDANADSDRITFKTDSLSAYRISFAPASAVRAAGSNVIKSSNTDNWNTAENAHELQYVIDINPNAGHIGETEDGTTVPITLTDNVRYYTSVNDNAGNPHAVSMNLKDGSTKLQRLEDGRWVDIPSTDGWSYTLEENAASSSETVKAKQITVTGIPDDTALRFVYTYNVEVQDLPKNSAVALGVIRNTATLTAAEEESDSITVNKIWRQMTDLTGMTKSLTLIKVQEGNYANTLEGSYFKLEKFVPSADGVDANGSWEQVAAIGGTADPDGGSATVLKTDANGKIVIQADATQLGDAGYYQPDQLYRVREYKAPDGFMLEDPAADSNPSGYFYFHQGSGEYSVPGKGYNGSSEHADNLIVETDTIYLGNRHETDSITAGKIWNASNVWPGDVTSVELTLFDKDDNPIQEPKTLTAAGQQAKWEGIEVDEDHPLSSYKVVETAISLSSGETLTRQNKGEGYIWTDGDGATVFETIGGKVTNGMATIVNSSKIQLTAEKRWATQDIAPGTQVILTLVKRERLYAQNGQIEPVLPNFEGEFTPVSGVDPLTLSGSTWTGSFPNLERFRYDASTGRMYEIQYSVTEQVMQGSSDVTDRYLATITRDTADQDKITVLNTSNVGPIKVHKIWVRANAEGGPEEEGEAPDGIDAVTISIERTYEDEDGVTQSDEVFNEEHKSLQIKKTDIVDGTAWTVLFENLQRQNPETGTLYQYTVKEGTVEGFTKKIEPESVRIEDGSTGQTAAVTVTNIENQERHEEVDFDLKLGKAFTTEEGTPSEIPEGASAELRLYRYVTIERGDYDVITDTMTPVPADCEPRSEDLEFNGADKDAQWTVTIGTAAGTPTESVTKDGTTYTRFVTGWEDLPITETVYRDDSYVKYTYEYYVTEKSAEDAANHSYTAMYVDCGKDSPIKESKLVIEGESRKAEAEIRNVPGDQTLTIRKYWVMSNQDSMPGVVISLRRRKTDAWGNPNGEWEDVDAHGISTNGVLVNGKRSFTDSNGNTVYGYLLNTSNEWNYSFTGLESGYQYQVIELGYFGKKQAGGQEVVIRLDDYGPFLSRHYKYSETQKEILNLSNLSVAQLENYFSDSNGNQDMTKNNYGTFSIGNIPHREGYQLHMEKKWYSFTGAGGFADITSGYTGKGSGSKEAAIIMQVYQRPYWATNEYGHQGQWASNEWVEYKKPLEITYSAMNAAESGFPQSETQHNGWVENGLQESAGFAEYGYVMNDQGIYELVFYEYKFEEIGTKPGSDGRSYRTYADAYQDEPVNHEDNPNYYTSRGKILFENYETGLLKLIKDWKLTDPANKAKKIYYAITDHRGNDIAKQIYESDNKEYYGVTADQVAYIRKLDKYVIVLDADDAVVGNENRWELMLSGLDIIEEIEKVDGQYVGKGEVTYAVEEVGCETANGTIYAMTDEAYPYTSVYYRKVRFNGEQLVGNTAGGQRMVADGLQLDSGRAYDESGSLTTARVVNSDEPVTHMTVDKIWPDGLYPDLTMKVVLELQQRRQKTDSGGNPLFESDGKTPVWADGWTAAEGTSQTSVTLPRTMYSGSNAWTYTWKDLPVYKEISDSGTENAQHDVLWYRVVETSSPGWTSTTYIAYNEDGTTSEIGGDALEQYNGQSGLTEDGMHLGVRNDTRTEKLKVQKKWTSSSSTAEDHSIEWPEGYTIDYKVVRHTYLTAVTQDGDGKVSYERGFEITDWLMDPLVTGTLTSEKQAEVISVGGSDELPKGGLVRTDNNPPTGLHANYTYAVEYEYEVIETVITSPDGTEQTEVAGTGEQDPSDASMTVSTITNDLTSIEVEKIWSDGNDKHTADYVQVQLYRSLQRPDGPVPVKTDSLTVKVSEFTGGDRPDKTGGQITFTVAGDDGNSYGPFTLTPENNWTYTIENLPKTSSSDVPITYTVTITGTDGEIIDAASIGGSSSAIAEAGDTVGVTANVTEPPASFKLNFNLNWILNEAWTATTAPTNPAASIEVVLSYAGTQETITLNSAGKI